MTPKQIQELTFKAMQEAHKVIGGYTAHRNKSNILERKGKALDKIAAKYGLNPIHLNNVYFGKV